MTTLPPDLQARVEAVLAADAGFAGRFFYQPGHILDRGIGAYADYCAVGGALAYVTPERDYEDASLIDRDDVTEIGAIDQHIAEPMAVILNDAPAVIRDLLELLNGARPLPVIQAPGVARPYLPRSFTRFSVVIEGKVSYYTQPDDAVAFARAGVFLPLERVPAMVALLMAGKRAEWRYGFAAVTVHPPVEGLPITDVSNPNKPGSL